MRPSQGPDSLGLMSVRCALHEVRVGEVRGAAVAPALPHVTQALSLPGSGNS